MRFGAALAAAPVVWWGLSFILPVSPGHPWREFLLFAFAVPVVEEIVFRGLVQGLLRKRFDAVTAIVVTSVLFSALHLVSQSPWWAAAVFVPSLVFGYFRERTHGLAAPIALHCWYNAGFFWIF